MSTKQLGRGICRLYEGYDPPATREIKYCFSYPEWAEGQIINSQSCREIFFLFHFTSFLKRLAKKPRR